jgi:hypothetical protein
MKVGPALLVGPAEIIEWKCICGSWNSCGVCRGRFDCCSRGLDNGAATILEALCGDVGDLNDWLLLRRSAAERRPSSQTSISPSAQPSSLSSPA